MKQTGWTHHHTRRGYHALTFSVSVITVAFLAWSLGIALTVVGATTAPQEDLSRNSQVTLEPSAVTTLDPIDSTKLELEPSINVVPGDSIRQRYVLQDGEVQPIFIFQSQFPKFIGLTNSKDVTAVLDIFGPDHVTGKTKVDPNGNWAWETTVPLKPGTYIFNVKAVENISGKAIAKDSLLFEVVLEKGQKVETIEVNNIPQLGNNGNLFDVRATILDDFKKIKQGDELQADIKFVNIGTAGKPVDVEVRYTISNIKDEVISESTETVAVSNELVYNKTFPTSESIAPGFYTLTVAIPSEDLIATASDNFEVLENRTAVSLLTENSFLSNKTLMLELLGGIIFLGILVAYMEYNKVVILSRHIKRAGDDELFNPKKKILKHA